MTIICICDIILPVAIKGDNNMNNTKIKISNQTIEKYKNEKNFLEDLNLKIKSGSCTLYDITLYNRLKENEKSLNLNPTI